MVAELKTAIEFLGVSPPEMARRWLPAGNRKRSKPRGGGGKVSRGRRNLGEVGRTLDKLRKVLECIILLFDICSKQIKNVIGCCPCGGMLTDLVVATAGVTSIVVDQSVLRKREK